MYFENSCVDNFRKRMYEMGIGYWGRWFENIHNTNFIPEVDWVEHVTTMPVELILGDVLTAIKWLEELEIRGARYLNEARIILLGEKGAGKTSLARRLVDPNAKMPDERESTEGVDITALKIRDICPEISEDKNANVHIWDFAGHSITHAVHRCFLSERCIYIIVYDGRTEGRNRLDYWLNHVRDYGGDSKVYILANIKDKNKPELEENYIKRHYEKHRCEFIYFSIKDDAELLYQFRIQLAIYISIDPAWGQNIPVNYFYTKEKLKEAFGNDRDYISIAEFKNVSFGGNQNMLRALHSLGICLYYEEIDALNTLILNPKWITWGVYHIIAWLKNISEDYQLKIEDFFVIFENNLERYPQDKYIFLYKLMINYELAYEDTNRRVLIIPQCLKKDQPNKLPDFPYGRRLYTRFDASQKEDNIPMPFPPDIMPRIIVNRSVEARNTLSKVWRYGALLYYSASTYALIQQKDSVIQLIVAGEERQQYHESLRNTILNILNTYTSFQENQPQIKYELVEHPETMYPQDSLINLAKKGLAEFEDFGLGKTIDVRENMQQYTINFNIENLTIDFNRGKIVVGERVEEVEIHNYNYSSVVMENRLNELRELLESNGQTCPKEIKKVSRLLRRSSTKEKCNRNKKIKELLSKIQEQLIDEKSSLHNMVKAFVGGAKIIKEIIEAYNNLAKTCGW